MLKEIKISKKSIRRKSKISKRIECMRGATWVKLSASCGTSFTKSKKIWRNRPIIWFNCLARLHRIIYQLNCRNPSVNFIKWHSPNKNSSNHSFSPKPILYLKMKRIKVIIHPKRARKCKAIKGVIRKLVRAKVKEIIRKWLMFQKMSSLASRQ